MATNFRVGALDFCRIRKGKSPQDAVWETIEVAPKLESFGYDRLWLAEHHTADVAHSCPEAFLPILLGTTEKMRIGTAGILLRYYSPLKVAKTFRLLQSVFPGRIDLGLARGTAPEPVRRCLEWQYGDDEEDEETTTPQTAAGETQAIPVRRTEDVGYNMKVSELLGFLRGTQEVRANPAGVPPPTVWILGSNDHSMRLAARHGVAMCWSLFLSGQEMWPQSAVVGQYEESFAPSQDSPRPEWRIAVAGVCARSESKAKEMASNARGVYPYAVGTPEQCRGYFEQLGERFRTKDFIFLDVSETAADRITSCELLANALNL